MTKPVPQKGAGAVNYRREQMRRLIGVSVVAALALVIAPAAFAIDKVNTKQLRKAVTPDGVLQHERALQQIALANDDTRAATTPGQNATVDYVVSRMKQAGYKVHLDPFDFPIWTLNSPSTFAEASPTARTFTEDTDYIVSQFSGAGDVTAQVVPTNDIEIPPSGGPGAGTSGCEMSDFPPETAGNIALMQRGTCAFTDKFANAKQAGAAAALIFNDGFEDRTEPLFITAPTDMGIPAVMTSSTVGESLYAEAQSGPVSAHIVVDATTTPHEEMNVIADSKTGRKGRTILSGAHLDSVPEGPGINDDGSGISTQLAVAEQMARLKQDPLNRVRFAFWGAEEAGLVGSTAYVADQVANGKINQVEANLDFDMLGSPNFVRFVYDGDLSDSEPPPSGAPDGSAQIEDMYLRYFRSKSLPTEPTAFDGRSDYGPFIENGVPAGGIFTGAEGIKTPAEEAIFGGVAGLQYDPCYHLACDTFSNVSRKAINQMSDATTHSIWTLARSESPITQFQGAKATASKAKKARKAKARVGNATDLPYQGPFPVR
jgi:Zn-dependent M28 family amino/carboxypeptidase